MSKYIDIANTMKRQILRGDYNLKVFPAERELAEQMGVARSTVREALRELLEGGVVERKPNGRLGIPEAADGAKKELLIAYLCPSFPSDDAVRWQLAAQRAVEKYGHKLRPVHYMHWDDTIVRNTLLGFDGVFLIPTAEDVPAGMIEWFRDEGCPFALTCGDWTKHGVPSVTLCPPEWIHHVLDHLEGLGHRRIDLFNAQPHEDTTCSRIEQWNLWRMVHGCGGELFDVHVQPYQWSTQRAYEAMNQILDEGRLHSSAIVATSDGAAISVCSALIDHGYEVGKDVSVATLNDGGMCKLIRPTVTCIEMPDAVPYLSICVEWMARGGKGWIGPLLVKPSHVPLHKGQSTGKAPVTDSDGG